MFKNARKIPLSHHFESLNSGKDTSKFKPPGLEEDDIIRVDRPPSIGDEAGYSVLSVHSSVNDYRSMGSNFY